MPIEFRVRSLHVTGFRGVKSFSMELTEGSPAVLIGPNNSGKSTILDAIALALNGPSSFNFSPEKFDFFHQPSGQTQDTFDIRVQFDAKEEIRLPAVRGGIGNPVPVHGVAVFGSTEKSGRLQHRTTLLDGHGKPILLASGIPLKGSVKEAYKDHGISYSQRYARWSDIVSVRPDVWLLRPDNLFVSLYQWKTGPLQRLAKLLTRRFFENTWQFEYKGTKREMPSALRSAHAFLTAALREFPFWKDDLRPRLERTMSQYLGRQAKMDLAPSIEAIEEWLSDQLMLSFAADSGGAATPLAKMGSGWQSLVRIASLEVLSQYPDEVSDRVVLLFEEPETYLHPHLARKLRSVMDRVAALGWTVVMTSHSPNMVSFGRTQQIVKLSRRGDELLSKALLVAELDGAAKFQERLDERGAHEMVFAKKVVLCEGQDDVFAVKSYLERRRAIDLDGGSISIVRTGDVNQLPSFAAMASKLGIDWCALSDEDRLPDGTIKPATLRARDKVSQHQTLSDMQVSWPGDLEQCLHKPQGKADAEWQVANVETKSDEEVKLAYPEFWNTCAAIEKWLSEDASKFQS
jgi:putative ATP-dependent endonuclease of the OLD family